MWSRGHVCLAALREMAGMSDRGVGFAQLLKRRRVAAGMTQEGLAEAAGLSAKAISELERDPGRRPRLQSVMLLADALGLDTAGRDQLLAAAQA